MCVCIGAVDMHGVDQTNKVVGLIHNMLNNSVGSAVCPVVLVRSVAIHGCVCAHVH